MALRMAVVDLDGTLTRGDGSIAACDSEALARCSDAGVIRAVATGRHLFAARKILPASFPIDYLIFSSGAGIVDWKTGELLSAHHLESDEVALATAECLSRGLDFIVHHPVPQNHFFFYRASGRENPDFRRRCERHAEFSTVWNETKAIERASQLLVIESIGRSRMLELYEELRLALPGLNVIRATSPLDGKSLWIELFPKRVAKSAAAEWLAARHGIAATEVCAVGNDYNDLDLLDWAGLPFVVGNSPPELKERYPLVASHEHCGVAQAIALAIRRSPA